MGTRKRSKNPECWKTNVEKQYRHKSALLHLKLPTCGHNTTLLKCATLTKTVMKKFHESLYTERDKVSQDQFLLRNMRINQVHRHRKTSDRYSTVQCSTKYFVGRTPVCLQTFLSITNVSRFRLNRLSKTVFNHNPVREKRGGFRKSEDFESQRRCISEFLDKLEYSEAHYCRSSTERKYLTSDLNINKLYNMFIEDTQSNEFQNVKRSYFRFVFNNFYNFGFRSPRSDVCSTCLSFSEKIATEKDPEKKIELMASKAIHKKRAKAFFSFLRSPADNEKANKSGSTSKDRDSITSSSSNESLSTLNSSDASNKSDPNFEGNLSREKDKSTFIMSYDCQKNLPLLKVPDTAAYYSRNIYMYNFTVVEGYSRGKDILNPDKVTSYCWIENEYAKNANAIASCVVFHLQSIRAKISVSQFSSVRLVSDGCAAQNKNSIMISSLADWLAKDAPSNITEVEMIFPVTGHSFLPPDRVFAHIEKIAKRKDSIITPNDYLEIIEQFATVRRLCEDHIPIFDYKSAMTTSVKTTPAWKCSISQMKRIYITKKNSGNVMVRGEPFYFYDQGTEFSIWKRGCSVHNFTCHTIAEGVNITTKKVKDIEELLAKHYGDDWKELDALRFFVELLYINVVPLSVDEQNREEDSEHVDDPGMPICCSTTELPEFIV